jgi:hypothetical protein
MGEQFYSMAVITYIRTRLRLNTPLAREVGEVDQIQHRPRRSLVQAMKTDIGDLR